MTKRCARRQRNNFLMYQLITINQRDGNHEHLDISLFLCAVASSAARQRLRRRPQKSRRKSRPKKQQKNETFNSRRQDGHLDEDVSRCLVFAVLVLLSVSAAPTPQI